MTAHPPATLPSGTQTHTRPTKFDVYLVTDTGLCAGPEGVIKTAVAAAQAGVDIVQLRDPNATTGQLVTMASALVRALAPFDVPLVINDRLDVALAAGAQGVHIGQRDLPPVMARALANQVAGPNFHVGLSVSNLAELDAAAQLPPGTIDLVGIGPFRDTATKPDAAPALGLSGVAAIAKRSNEIGLQNVVIGGVKQPDVAHLVDAGARGVAVVSAICGQTDPAAATRDLVRAVQHAKAAQPQSDRPNGELA